MYSTPPLLTIRQFLLWAGLYGYYFLLFWTYLPFALAARELSNLHRRYI